MINKFHQAINSGQIIGMVMVDLGKAFDLVDHTLLLKLRSHRANGREADEKSFHPFVSDRIRFMSVSNPVNPFLVR